MRLSCLVSPIALVSIAACSASTAGPTSRLDGSWQTWPNVPAGGTDLALSSAGPIVSGTGHEYGGSSLRYSLTITGQQAFDGSFRLTLTSDSGRVFTYSGRVVGSDGLEGEWTGAACNPAGSCSYSLTFRRQ